MTTTISSARPSHTYSPLEFEHESRRIDALTFDTLALTEGESVVFCGFSGNIGYVRRAIDIGCKVAVIEARESIIREHADLGVRTIRGSTSVIPARDLAFDVAIAAGYLHEVDPSFHTQILTELARVAKRVALIELAPPTDPLGRRIAALYQRAKREFGSFEHYQGVDYWKKLLAMVKPDVAQSIFQFGKLPPIEYLIDTVDLLLDTIEAEEAPEEDVEELRRIAKRSNAMLLPQARLVLIGAAMGEIPKPTYSQAAIAPAPTTTVETVRSAPATTALPASAPAPVLAPAAAASAPTVITSETITAPSAPPPAAPPVTAAPINAPQPVAQPAASPAFAAPELILNPFGLPDTQQAAPANTRFAPPTPPAAGTAEHPPFGAPFPVPPAPDSSPFGTSPGATVPGWTWEPPEDDRLG
jgi:translation initiation factor IF-2